MRKLTAMLCLVACFGLTAVPGCSGDDKPNMDDVKKTGEKMADGVKDKVDDAADAAKKKIDDATK